MTDVILVVLAGATVVALLVLVLNALAQLRDEIVNQGWVSEQSRLGRMTKRAEVARARLLLQSLGIEREALERYRAAGDPLGRQARKLSKEVADRPDISFLRRLKRWTYELPSPYTYRGSPYYLDMMGAVYQREPYEAALEQIFLSWLNILIERGAVPHFDCVLAPKEGNPLLARAVAKVSQKHLILCKGENDRSLVTRPADDAAHETDFEGLRAFLTEEDQKGRPAEPRYRAVVIDDSCRGGSQICSAVRRFNEYVETSKLPFARVGDVVVLFRVKDASGQAGNRGFQGQDLHLHALLAVGPEELKFLAEVPSVDDAVKELERFKGEPFSCAQSRALLRI
ncbi:MAG: hypothetical protein WD844_17515 [Thermoleophilaceae bacterium]